MSMEEGAKNVIIFVIKSWHFDDKGRKNCDILKVVSNKFVEFAAKKKVFLPFVATFEILSNTFAS